MDYHEKGSHVPRNIALGATYPWSRLLQQPLGFCGGGGEDMLALAGLVSNEISVQYNTVLSRLKRNCPCQVVS